MSKKGYQFWIKIQDYDHQEKSILCHVSQNPEPMEVIVTKLEQALATAKSLLPNKGVYQCPLCKAPMIRRTGKFGYFYACTAWKTNKCKGTRNDNGNPPEWIQELAEKKPVKKEETSSDLLDNIEIE